MLKDVSDRVFKELTSKGYDPKLHPSDEGENEFELRLRGETFDIDDFKTLVRTGEMFGVGMKVDSNGWLTLH
jgi:hypothetical protein